MRRVILIASLLVGSAVRADYPNGIQPVAGVNGADAGPMLVGQDPSANPWSMIIADGGPLAVTGTVAGTVAVSNFPATQPVSGTVAVSNFPATQPVSGSVSVSNFPGTQPVSGSVSVSNFPGTQPVSGTVTANVQGVARAQGSAPPTTSAGSAAPEVTDLYGDRYVLIGSPNHGNAFTAALGASLTQQVAAPAAATSIYITSITCQSTTSTASTMTVEWGTGTNCGTGTVAAYITPCTANTVAASVLSWPAGYQVPAANALCAICSSGTNTCKLSINWYIAN